MVAEIAGEDQPAFGRGDAGQRRRRRAKAPFHLSRVGIGGDHEAAPIGILLAEKIAITSARPLLAKRDACGLRRIDHHHGRAPIFRPVIDQVGVRTIGGAIPFCASRRTGTEMHGLV